MADEKVSALSSATPVATDLLYVVTDALGTPVSSKTDISTLAGVMAPLIGAVTGSGQANQVAYWTDTDEIGGNAGFTFDPAATQLTLGDPMTSTFVVQPITLDQARLVVSVYETNPASVIVEGAKFIAESDSGAMSAQSLVRAAYFSAQIDSGVVTDSIGIQVGDISGATTNRAIQTGEGIVSFGNGGLVYDKESGDGFLNLLATSGEFTSGNTLANIHASSNDGTGDTNIRALRVIGEGLSGGGMDPMGYIIGGDFQSTANKDTGYLAGLFVAATVLTGTTDDPVALDISASVNGGTADEIRAIRIYDVTGATTKNIAIETGVGDIVFGTLAGTGTRAVMVDANGKLSAP